MRENRELVFLDLERNNNGTKKGMYGGGGRIIEVAAQRARLLENGIELDGEPFVHLIDPGESLSENVKELTGLTNEALKGKPTFEDIEGPLFDYLGGRVVLAHEAYKDVKALTRPLFSHGFAWTPPVVCTRIFAQTISGKTGLGFSLEEVCKRFNIERGSAHQALSDVQACIGLVGAWLSCEETAAKFHRSMGESHPPEFIKSIPRLPGVLGFQRDRHPPRLMASANLQREFYEGWLSEHCSFPKKTGDFSNGIKPLHETAPGFFTAVHRVLSEQNMLSFRSRGRAAKENDDDFLWKEGRNTFVVKNSKPGFYILNGVMYEVKDEGRASLSNAVSFCRRQQEKAKQDGNKNA